MSIRKQEFYEGAALHILARGGRITHIEFTSPFIIVNQELRLLLKYSTRGRSPWAFTFTVDEQRVLDRRSSSERTVIGLICGSDGVAALNYESYRVVAEPRAAALHVACYRRHGAHYEISGPDGVLTEKIAPGRWARLLEPHINDET